MPALVLDLLKSPIHLVAANGAAQSIVMAESVSTAAHLAAGKVANPERRRKLEEAAEWASRQTTGEVRAMAREIGDASAGRHAARAVTSK